MQPYGAHYSETFQMLYLFFTASHVLSSPILPPDLGMKRLRPREVKSQLIGVGVSPCSEIESAVLKIANIFEGFSSDPPEMV